MLASINIKLTIMMVSVVPLVGVAAVLLVGIIRKYSKKIQDQVAESQVVVEETMQGIKQLRPSPTSGMKLHVIKIELQRSSKNCDKGDNLEDISHHLLSCVCLEPL
jgi:ABC-type bacteriocin/lantibiotic exporter with double-glycine peptidase domain